MPEPSRNESSVKLQPWNDPTAQPYIQLVNIEKKFGEFIAVNNISLDIFKGEFFSLLGPSGCGKSTLLRMLAGFEAPTSGRLLLDDEDLAVIPPHKRPVNMMFQSYALFPHLNVEQNIAFGLKQDKVPKAEITQRVEEMINLVQLNSFARRKPHQLSGGQRRRVALARSLVKKPKMLLLDEPLGALDKKLREQTQFELVNIQEELGITFIIVTHDQEEAMTVSTRIAVMDHGRIVQVATPTEVYEFPHSRYVAGFIGNINIIEGNLTRAGENFLYIQGSDAECSLKVTHSVDALQGQRVWAALRPEKVKISKDPPADTEYNCITGKVWDIGYLGNMSVYHVKLPNGKMLIASQANVDRVKQRVISWDEDVYLTFSSDAAVVLLD